MRRLIVSEFVTLDGVMEAPGGERSHPHTGWVFDYEDKTQVEFKFQEVVDADALLVGRVTYESFAGAWPGYEGEFAERMNTIQKYVVSSTLREPEWSNTEVLDGDVVAAVRGLKEQDGSPILVAGSCMLVHTLLDNDLVDELRLQVFPVTIGAGVRLFSDTIKKTPWRLTDSVTYPSGMRADTFVPATTGA